MDTPGPQNSMYDTSHVRVGADVAGVLVMVGAAVVLLLGVPPLKWVFAAALTTGCLYALALSLWHQRHPGPRRPVNSINLP